MKSKYYYLFLYIYKHASQKEKDFYKYIIENERIKRGLYPNRCK